MLRQTIVDHFHYNHWIWKNGRKNNYQNYKKNENLKVCELNERNLIFAS